MSSSPSTCAGSSPAAMLFDPPRVANLLAECLALDPPAVPRDVRVDRCWPVGDGGLLLQWSFELDSTGRLVLFGRLWGSSEDPACRFGDGPANGAKPRITEDGLRSVWMHNAGLNCTVHSPDCDPFMPHLQACLDGDAAALNLAARGLAGCPVGDGPSRLGVRMLGYKPGRRATIAYQAWGAMERSARVGAPRRLVGKTYHDDRSASVAARHERLAGELLPISGGRVGVPTPLGLVADLRMIVFERVSGEPIGRSSASLPSADVDGVVEALAALHRVSPHELPDFTVADECRVLRRWHDAMAVVDTTTAAQIEELLRGILHGAEAIEPGPACAVHRDFHETQLIVHGGRTTLLDLDTLSRGDACVDLGNFLAHVFLRNLRCGMPADSFAPLVEAALRRYEEAVGPVAGPNLHFYLASSLFRLGVVHGLRTLTRRYSGSLWQMARNALRGKEVGC